MAETKALEPSVQRALAKKEAHEARLAARRAKLATLVEDIKLSAAKITSLRKHAFKSDEELTALGFSDQEKALIRQWEVPKKSTAFAVESAAKLVEAQVKGQEAAKGNTFNVENLTIKLPQKNSEVLPEPVVIEVEAK